MKYISGIRPTGKLHLGNYIGSILPALKYDADVLVAQYHAPDGDYMDFINAMGIYSEKDIDEIPKVAD